MWKWKKKDPVKTFHFLFKVVYRLSNGKEKETEVISVNVPARTEHEAKSKLNRFVIKKIEVKIIL